MEPLSSLLALTFALLMETRKNRPNGLFNSLFTSPGNEKSGEVRTSAATPAAPAPTEASEAGKSKKGCTEEPQPVDERMVAAVVERIRSEIPDMLAALSSTPPSVAVSETLDAVYLGQIASAQAFLNENGNADLSRVKRFLRMALPQPYHSVIDRLRQQQDPQVIVRIYGGQNVIAPKAERAGQDFGKK